MHDRNVRNLDEDVQAPSGHRGADVMGRTHDALARIEEHVDSATIARRLGCSAKHIREEISRGHLPYVRLGRKRVVPVSAVEAYVAARAVGDHPARRSAVPILGLAPVRRRTA